MATEAKTKTTKAQMRATTKYQKANTKIIPLRLNFKHDKDILDKLDEVENKAGYIKALIRADIAREN